MSGLPESGHGWAIEQRCAVLLLILSMTLTGLVVDKARAGEQTRLYGSDGRSIGIYPFHIRRKRALISIGSLRGIRPFARTAATGHAHP